MGIIKRGGRRCLRRDLVWQTGMSAPRRLAAACLLLGALWGCSGGKSGPATVPATGTVTLGGNPVEGASVVFYPDGADDSRLTCQAVTDSAGHYEMRTHVGGGKFKSGIVPGKYTVAITKLDTASIKSTLAPPPNLLPRKYADPKTSQLKADVVEDGKNDSGFALKAD